MIERNAIEPLIAEVSRLRDRQAMSSVDKRKRLDELADELGEFYWSGVRSMVLARVRRGDEALEFDREERLFIDMAFLDGRLLELGARAEDLRTQMVKELYQDQDCGVYYLSEWLERRYANHQVLLEVQRAQAERASLESRRSRRTQEVHKLREARRRVYARLQAGFGNLPGIGPQVVEAVCSGRLDEHIEGILVTYLRDRDGKRLRDRERFVALRRKVVGMARARAAGPMDMELFDALEKVEKQINDAIVSMARHTEQIKALAGSPAPAGPSTEAGGSREVEVGEVCDFLGAEMGSVRTLLVLGAIGGGLRQDAPFLHLHLGRITRRAVADSLAHIREFDLGWQGEPEMVIAPFRGSGFFDWDRDTIFVPLLPVGEVERAVIGAATNYRVLMDARAQGGRLRQAFREAFPDEPYRQRFGMDYEKWLLKTARGVRGALSPKSFEFLRAQLGPPADGVLGPPELLRLEGDAALEAERRFAAQVNGEEVPFQALHGLATLKWKRGRLSEAIELMERAVRVRPTEPRVLYSLGLLHMKAGQRLLARRFLQECRDNGQNTLWQVYAWDLLNKL
ncbi:MAG: hypothetical protein HY722_15760 [Planctomycetes bacterium]|nr:hypothetical protein [Planctomycetota bacterium]